jgi:hypothetical protein
VAGGDHVDDLLRALDHRDRDRPLMERGERVRTE